MLITMANRYRPKPLIAMKQRRAHSVQVLLDSAKRISDGRPIERKVPTEIQALEDWIDQAWKPED
jgi:hypothetical protein